MAVDSPEFINSALKVYNAEVHRAIKAQEQRLAQLKDARDQLETTIKSVAELPAKLRHQLMVPLGRHAFFPGHLTRTNEILVHLGDQYYVETSAVAAKGILQRRLAVLTEGVGKAQQQLQALQARLEVTHSSLKDERSGEDSFEIRSSLEESDALLAMASKHRRSSQAAAAAAGLTQQQQGAVRRVTAASGYSYNSVGTPQVHQQQQSDPADAALQARLAELIRLEEQQEAVEQAELWGKQELESIQEDEEEAEDGVGQASAAGAPAAAAAAEVSSSVPRSTAMQHLQQLEQEADSDDEDENQQQLQQSALAAAAGSSSSSSSAATSLVASKALGNGLKSALKKGFLTSSSNPRASGSSHTTAKRATSSSTSSTSEASSSISQSNKAFIGTVLERAAPDTVEKNVVAPSASIGAVFERPVAPPAAPPVAASRESNSTAASRPSKFKLRRMGLEPQDQ